MAANSTHDLQPDSRLFPLFFDCYQKFDDWFDESASNDAIICFGVSGAGKSTYLARLCEKTTPDQFYRALPSTEGGDKPSKATIGTIDIGAGMGSTTLIPKLHSVGGLRIFDVPGFKDSDDNKQIVINILHKCLLTRVQRAKFLVILSVQDLFEDEKFGTAIDDYHNKLKELFGESNYVSFIETLHFVLTHNDGGKHSEDDVKMKLSDAVNTIFEKKIKNKFLAEFLSRIKTNHTMVDYTKNTGEELLSVLTEAMTRNPEEGDRIPEMERDKLDLHANAMNTLCVSVMARKTDYLEELRKENLDCFQKHEERLKRDKKDIFDAETKRAQLTKDIQGRVQSIEDNETLINDNKKMIVELTGEIDQEDRNIIALEDQQKFFKEELGKFKSVSLRADVARQTGVIRSEYSFKSDVMLSESERENSTILVISDEANEETLREHMANNGSLVPKDIKLVQNCSKEVVYFNDIKRIHNRTMLPTASFRYDPRSQLLSVNLVGLKKFKVLIYTAVDFSTTPAALVQREHYGKSLARSRGNLEDLIAKKSRTEKETEHAEMEIHRDRVALINLREQVASSEKDVANKKTDFSRNLEAAKSDIVRANLGVTKLSIARGEEKPEEHDKDATLIEEIGRIFHKNKLKTDLTANISKHDGIVSKLKIDIGEWRATFESLSRLEVVKSPEKLRGKQAKKATAATATVVPVQPKKLSRKKRAAKRAEEKAAQEDAKMASSVSIPGYATTYTIVSGGSGPAVAARNTVTVHAKGVVEETGKKFCSTKDPGQVPIQYQAGVKQVIEGWDQGVLGMQLGEIRSIRIPAHEGYGAGGFPTLGIPADATIVFEIEVLKIQ